MVTDFNHINAYIMSGISQCGRVQVGTRSRKLRSAPKWGAKE